MRGRRRGGIRRPGSVTCISRWKSVRVAFADSCPSRLNCRTGSSGVISWIHERLGRITSMTESMLTNPAVTIPSRGSLPRKQDSALVQVQQCANHAGRKFLKCLKNLKCLDIAFVLLFYRFVYFKWIHILFFLCLTYHNRCRKSCLSNRIKWN